MQTISIPYSCAPSDGAFLLDLRREQSAAVRTAYANANGKSEQVLRDEVKARHAGGLLDAWALHCATREGLKLHKQRPEGKIVFGGRKNLIRRNNGLIGPEEWKSMRLRPLVSLGDKDQSGNRHFRLSSDGLTCSVRMYGRTVALSLVEMKGKWGILIRQVATLAAAAQINVTFSLGKKLEVTFDPMDLRKLPLGLSLAQAKTADGKPKRGRKITSDKPQIGKPWPGHLLRPVHPEWRDPLPSNPHRALGIDLNPGSIGLSVIENAGNSTLLSDTTILDYALMGLDFAKDASNETVRETLAAVCDRAIRMARKNGAGLIVLEQGLGKLRSRGKSRALNRMLNYWARTVFTRMLTRKALLSGLKVMEIWGGFSTTIGNLAFEAPDACASACEIARRGLARTRGSKDVLPVFTPEVASRLWKDGTLPTQVRKDLERSSGWGKLHRIIKTAKLGVRRPHPALPDSGVPLRGETLLQGGHAVRRLKLRRRPGWLCLSTRVAAPASPVRVRENGTHVPTRKCG